MSEQDGGPAFPSLEIYEGYVRDEDRYEVKSDTTTGMSLRDYFAAKALPVVFAEFLSPDSAWAGYDDVAGSCYRIADAMLKARKG